MSSGISWFVTASNKWLLGGKTKGHVEFLIGIKFNSRNPGLVHSFFNVLLIAIRYVFLTCCVYNRAIYVWLYTIQLYMFGYVQYIHYMSGRTQVQTWKQLVTFHQDDFKYSAGNKWLDKTWHMEIKLLYTYFFIRSWNGRSRKKEAKETSTDMFSFLWLTFLFWKIGFAVLLAVVWY